MPTATYREVIGQHHRILRQAFSDNDGLERGTEGDSFLVVFADAPSAIRAAVSAQHALEQAEWAGRSRVRVRMGLHTGLGVLGGDDYIGIDINRAARISAAGHGGQILVSGPTRALAEDSVAEGIDFRDLGEYRLKGIEKPERVFQLVVEGLSHDFPPLRTDAIGEAHVPQRMTSFVRRPDEISDVSRLLEESRLITLIGPGGTGKTSLAEELGRLVAKDYADGAWFVDLASVRDPDLVGSAIFTRLGLATKSQRSIEALLTDYLIPRELLLIIDNFEHLLPAANLVATLTTQCPRLTVLVTSRTSLNLYGEQTYPVPPLPLPVDTEEADLDLLAQTGAVSLFVERARSVDPHFTLTSDNAHTVSRICRRLDGLPLAIELAASRSRLLTVDEIAARLDDSLSLLSSTQGNRPSRHQTLAALIEWSYGLLSADEQTLFERMSHFVGGFSLEAVEKVCNPDRDLDMDTMEGVASLESQSLIRRKSSTGTTRFEMLETIRNFANDLLKKRPDFEDLADHHLEFFRDLGEAAEPHLMSSDQKEWLDRLELENGNLRQAMHTALASGDAKQNGLRLASSIWRFWFERGQVREGLDWMNSLIALSSDDVSAACAKAYTAMGGLAYWMADPTTAEAAYTRALDIYRDLGDEEAVAEALYNHAFAAGLRGDIGEAQKRMKAAMDAAQQVGSPMLIAQNQIGVAVSAWIAGDTEPAVAMIEEAVGVFRESGSPFHIAWGVGTLGQLYMQLGRIDQGRTAFLESFRLSSNMRNLSAITAGLQTLATVASSMGNHLEATRLSGAVEALEEETGSKSPLPDLARADLESARAALGPESFTLVFEEGRAMTMQEAVDYATNLLENL